MFHGTAHVVLGSGLTIAGATFCLSFTRLPYFQTLGVPLAIGMVVVRAGRADARRRGHRRGHPLRQAARTQAGACGCAAGARSAPPSSAGPARSWSATIALSLVGLLTLPGYQTNYNDRNYLPTDLPANEGYAAADRHFSQARMNPELLLIESDHDLRNSADFLVIDKIAKAIFRVAGHRPGAGDHPARRQADRAHVDPVPDQHAGHHPAD